MQHYRAIWISDVHLGTKGCKAAHLNAFLKEHTCEYLYLVGDIIDGWRMRQGLFWPSLHNRIIRRFIRKAEKENTKVIYIPGNHDEFLREYIHEHKLEMGNIRIVNEAYHETENGDLLWIVHGDAYDGVAQYHRWLTFAGDAGYNFLIWINIYLNRIRKLFGLPYWSLSNAVKNKVKRAVSYMFEFEHTIAREALRRKTDGVICGHIHQPAKKLIGKVQYYNCGDWVENCTALVEDDLGLIQLLYWAEIGHEDSDNEVVPELNFLGGSI
ncbi:MAG: UDP-2,3-diacylglucosamine diphosphatase [Candidatus Marinimicrobia bacterium]|nr:UDP-2,3-diacylglucosamine diphosphatase [Candidatus Neomarinimicrobiota bacterium]